MSRTALQREANDLDLEMFRLASQLANFADAHKKRIPTEKFADLARTISANRYYVRKYMHREDREATA